MWMISLQLCFFFSSVPELVKNQLISAAGYKSLSLVTFPTGEVTFLCSLYDFCQIITELSLITADCTVCLLGWWQWPCPWALSTGGTRFPALYERFLSHRSSCSCFVLYPLLSDRNILGSLCSRPSTPLPLLFFSSLLPTVMFHSKLNCQHRKGIDWIITELIEFDKIWLNK